MYSIVYVSRASGTMGPGELEALVATSRTNNVASAVTGLLVYCDGHFLQVLEGERDVVENLFERIGADDRHDDVRVVGGRDVDGRAFPSWTMGFERVDSMTLVEHLLAPLVENGLVTPDLVATAKIERFLANNDVATV